MRIRRGGVGPLAEARSWLPPHGRCRHPAWVFQRTSSPGQRQKDPAREAAFLSFTKQLRASEQILSVLMWGVSPIINELGDVPVPVKIMPDDSKAYSKIKVDNHLFRKGEPSQSLSRVQPAVFRNLPERFGIDSGLPEFSDVPISIGTARAEVALCHQNCVE